MLAAGGCRGGLCEKTSELSHAGHRWFQLAPKDPPQDTVEPVSYVCGASEKTYLRKGKNSTQAEEEAREDSEKQ